MAQSNTQKLMAQMVQEQQRTNELLAALIEALAEDDEDDGGAGPCYMDGTPR